MSEFKREDRYIVIKRNDLKKVPVSYRSSLVDPMFSLLSHLPHRECLVVESDWPEYEPVWRMIERRVSGLPDELAALREELASAKADKEAYAQNAIDLRKRAVAAERRNADDLRDANRYRWIRSQTVGHCEIQRTLFETISDDCNPPYRSLKYGKDLDDAIDAQAKPTESGASE